MEALAPTTKRHLGTHELEDLEYLRKDGGALTCLSLFSGCGGAALGIRQAGFEIRAMVEWEKAACDTLRANWVDRPENWREILAEEEKVYRRKRSWWNKMYATPHFWWQERPPAILQADITKLSTTELLEAAGLRVGECSILEGGFPCQGFSLANSKRSMEDSRNFLYLECVRIIREALPKTFMLENVPGLVSMEKGKVLRMICNDLANSGYQVSWDIHNAADFGVPQNRRRVIIIGSRNDLMAFPDHGEKCGCGPQFHIGGAAGPITHPEWFLKKYSETTQLSLIDQLK